MFAHAFSAEGNAVGLGYRPTVRLHSMRIVLARSRVVHVFVHAHACVCVCPSLLSIYLLLRQNRGNGYNNKKKLTEREPSVYLNRRRSVLRRPDARVAASSLVWESERSRVRWGRAVGSLRDPLLIRFQRIFPLQPPLKAPVGVSHFTAAGVLLNIQRDGCRLERASYHPH